MRPYGFLYYIDSEKHCNYSNLINRLHGQYYFYILDTVDKVNHCNWKLHLYYIHYESIYKLNKYIDLTLEFSKFITIDAIDTTSYSY